MEERYLEVGETIDLMYDFIVLVLRCTVEYEIPNFSDDTYPDDYILDEMISFIAESMGKSTDVVFEFFAVYS